MKKFLPLIVFILVFAVSVAGQVGWKNISSNKENEKNTKDSQYLKYEHLFLLGNFETIEGKKIEMTKVKAPVIIYNFWASWCNPCLEEIPSLISMKKKFKDEDLQVMAFNTDEVDQLIAMKKTLKKLNITNEFNNVADKNTKIADSFKFSSIPVTIIYNRGKVVYFSNGPMDFDSVEMIQKIKSWIKG